MATANLGRLQDGRRLEGPADLVVEIVSRDSVARDYDDKFSEYEEAGVQEYWIIDPRQSRKRASFFRLGADGRFETVTSEDGIYRSHVLTGFWLRLEWLWEMPASLSTLLEIVGLSDNTRAELEAKRKKGI